MKWRCKEIGDSLSLAVGVKPPVDETGVKGIVTVLEVGYDESVVQDLGKYPRNGYILEVLVPRKAPCEYSVVYQFPKQIAWSNRSQKLGLSITLASTFEPAI